MQFQLNTDSNIAGHDEFASEISAEVESRLTRFSDRITRIEVHLGDDSATRHGGSDVRCMIEARPAGRPPVAVTHHAASVGAAVTGGIGKLMRRLDAEFGRHDHRDTSTIRGGLGPDGETAADDPGQPPSR